MKMVITRQPSERGWWSSQSCGGWWCAKRALGRGQPAKWGGQGEAPSMQFYDQEHVTRCFTDLVWHTAVFSFSKGPRCWPGAHQL